MTFRPKYGQAVLVTGKPGCVHHEHVGYEDRRLIGRCQLCPRVIDYTLLQNSKPANETLDDLFRKRSKGGKGRGVKSDLKLMGVL